MSEANIIATPRDLYWVAVYLHTISEFADHPNLAPTVSKLLRKYADQATHNFCVAQCEADELAQGLNS